MMSITNIILFFILLCTISACLVYNLNIVSNTVANIKNLTDQEVRFSIFNACIQISLILFAYYLIVLKLVLK